MNYMIDIFNKTTLLYITNILHIDLLTWNLRKDSIHCVKCCSLIMHILLKTNIFQTEQNLHISDSTNFLYQKPKYLLIYCYLNLPLQNVWNDFRLRSKLSSYTALIHYSALAIRLYDFLVHTSSSFHYIEFQICLPRASLQIHWLSKGASGAEKCVPCMLLTALRFRGVIIHSNS